MRDFFASAAGSAAKPASEPTLPPRPAAPPPPRPPPLPSPSFSFSSLNAEQRTAVEASGGLVSVEAGPGSGKTRVITSRVAHLRGVLQCPGHRIAVLTFSNKAAKELGERIDHGAGGAAAGGRPFVGTFHALCMALLRADGSAVGVPANFRVCSSGDQLRTMREVLRKASGDGSGGSGGLSLRDAEEGGGLDGLPDARQCLSAVLERKLATATRAFDEEAPAPRAPDETDRLVGLYEAAMQWQRSLDFDDLLIRAVRLLALRPAPADLPPTGRGAERWRARFAHVLVDEFQDSSRIQCQLVAWLAAQHGNLFVVGDPQQTIYTWRQADRGNLAFLERRFQAAAASPSGGGGGAPGLRRLQLNRSYRATERVLACATAVLSAKIICGDERVPPDPHERPVPALTTANGAGPLVECHVYEDAAAEAAGVARHVRALLSAAPPLLPSDVGVLARTAAALRPIAEALKAEGIPAVIQDGQRLTERKDVGAALSLLELQLHRKSEATFERAARATRGLGDTAVRSLAQAAARRGIEPARLVLDYSRGGGLLSKEELRPNKTTRAACAALAAALEAIGSLVRARRPVAEMAAEAARFVEAQAAGGGGGGSGEGGESEGGGEGGGGLPLLCQLAAEHDASHGTAAVEAGSSPTAPSSGLGSFLQTLGLGASASEAGGIPSVSLSTVHKAKGLEWKHVWLVGVEDGMYPHALAVREAANVPALADALREERRLLFVAATRSRGGLVLSRAMRRHGEPTRPSPFTRALPAPACEWHAFLTREAASGYTSMHDAVYDGAELAELSGRAAAEWTAAGGAALLSARGGLHSPRVRAFLDAHCPGHAQWDAREAEPRALGGGSYARAPGADGGAGSCDYDEWGGGCGSGGVTERPPPLLPPSAPPQPTQHSAGCRCVPCRQQRLGPAGPQLGAQPACSRAAVLPARATGGSLGLGGRRGLGGGGSSYNSRPRPLAADGAVSLGGLLGGGRGLLSKSGGNFSRAAPAGSSAAPFKRPRPA